MNQQRENLNMLKWRLRAAAFVVALAAPLVGWAQNTIQAITSSQQAGSEVVRIEMAEPLEFYTLDGMNMVGSVTKQGRQFALLKVDNLLYQVKVGDYLGQNYGRILKISETEIALREIVQDAAGEWIERPGTLQLQEKAR